MSNISTKFVHNGRRLSSPFFFQDDNQSYLVEPKSRRVEGEWPLPDFILKEYDFQVFYHPYVCDIVRRLDREGIASLLSPSYNDALDRQRLHEWEGEATVFDSYQAIYPVITPRPREKFDFSLSSAYGLYNWELFFHIPFLVATRLSQNQRFESTLT